MLRVQSNIELSGHRRFGRLLGESALMATFQEPVLWIVAGYANLPQLFWLAIKRHVCGFYEATQRLSCDCTSAGLTQFDGRARGDDVIGNLTVSKLRASQVTVGMLAYRCYADS